MSNFESMSDLAQRIAILVGFNQKRSSPIRDYSFLFWV